MRTVPLPVTQTAASFRPNRVSAPNPSTLARVQPHHPSPWRRGRRRIARLNARRTHLFHHRSRLRNVGYHCALRNVFLVTSSGCTPAAHISRSHPLPRPRNVRQVRVRLERRGPRHLVRLHASPPPNRRVMMPRGDVRLAIWLLKVDTRRVFDSDTRSSSSHWQVRGLRSVQGT